ncbi:PREDICTED: centrosomal protein of 57 kDa-like [Dufourea novaeangliae]|uniref:centrosomal protein of 57 kDa-like n=1 Tax=Dufourea novaeangliae TaxID=178035 RepID=UPI000767A614|nr:PREDICTED: centrosomal protein of 57 kDa-like [Dufourea novaeangliae]
MCNTKYEEQNNKWQEPYKQHLTAYSSKLMQNHEHPKKCYKELILDNRNFTYMEDLPSTKDDLRLNTLGSLKNGTGGKTKVCRKIEKKEKPVPSTLPSKKDTLSKLDDVASLKLKKRRRRVHSSNSKSTVTTRDTNFVGRKDVKKRKQKSNNNRHTKSRQAANEVVEIYHNSAAKDGNNSVSPNKHSGIDSNINYINRTSLGTNKQHNVHAKVKCDNTNHYRYNCNISEDNGPDKPLKQCQSKQSKQTIEEKSTILHNQKYALEVQNAPMYTMEKCNSRQCQQSILQPSYCNPMITHSYEMPTLASKLKRVNRSYFGRFNFKNIPFVVGTSITPSHNIGLNIQQVLSIMKTRHPTVNGVTPLLIRKVSRGMKPVSTLMGQISNHNNKLPGVNSQMINTFLHKANSFLTEPFNVFENESVSLSYDIKALRNLNVNVNSRNVEEAVAANNTVEHEKFQTEKNTWSENQLNRWNIRQISQTADNDNVLKLFSSQQNVNTQMKVQDNHQLQSPVTAYKGNEYGTNMCNIEPINKNSNRIREVLINLHDQFEEMNTKYEKLQVELENSDDKKLKEEALTLEKELSAKEDEITAVINLYKEVMALKQQMKSLQGKNSYVCITTEVPVDSNGPDSSMPFTVAKSNGTIIQQKFSEKVHHRRRNTIIATREPTSLRLAGLLRQIQTFQKQLRLSS